MDDKDGKDEATPGAAAAYAAPSTMHHAEQFETVELLPTKNGTQVRTTPICTIESSLYRTTC